MNLNLDTRAPFSLLITTSFAVLCSWMHPATAAEPATNRQILERISGLRKGGTNVVYKDCRDRKSHGYYEFERDKKTGKVIVDQIVVCKNNVDIANEEKLWEVLVHEGTHAVQLCYENDLIFKPEEHPSMLREIKKFAPHYAEILSQQYVGKHGGPAEIEAFWMELQDPAYAIKEISQGCADESTGSQAASSRASASQESEDEVADRYKAQITARAEIVGARAAADCSVARGLMTKASAEKDFAEFVKTKQMQTWAALNRTSVDKASAALQYAFNGKCEFRDDVSEEDIGLKIIKYVLD